MPYANVPDELQDKMESCVMQLVDKGREKESAIAICYTSVVEGKSLEEAMKSFELEELKLGARNSAKDSERLQQIHDYAVENGAVCPPKPEVEEMPLPKSAIDPAPIIGEASDALVAFGGAVKSLGDGRVGGYLVRYSTENDPDISRARDFFTSETDFVMNFPGKSPTWFNHTYPVKSNKDGKEIAIKKRLSHDADLTETEFGIWAESILDERDRYEKYLLELAQAGKLGWSSGVPNHLAERISIGKAHQVTRWPLGADASYTHIQAEPRNVVIPLKSLGEFLPPLPPLPDELEGVTALDEPNGEGGEPIKSNLEVTKMDITEEKLQEMLEAAVAKGAEKALKSLPAEEIKAGVAVTHDEADTPFKSMAEQCKAVKLFEVTKGHRVDPRLTRLEFKGIAGTGASEAVPSEGGFMLEPELGGEILRPMHETGPFTQAWQRLPTTKNHGWMWGVDETSRATGSRWGGIRGYRLAEGDTISASKPAFRKINWELGKYAALCYATDELLEDAPAFSAIVRTGVGEEFSFMANDDAFRGNGGPSPLGILNTSAYVSVAKETGQAADSIVFENLSKMWARLLPRSRTNATWYINVDVEPQLDTLAIAAGTSALEPRYVTYGQDGVMRIKGRPVMATEFNPTVGDLGDIALLDMSYYLAWMKEVQSASSIHVQFLTDETVFRFTLRITGQPAIASALTPYKGVGSGNDTLSPFVLLAERA